MIPCSQDLLEKGKSSGALGRLLCNPGLRKALDDAEMEELKRIEMEKELAKSGADNKDSKGKTSIFIDMACLPHQ